MVSGESVHANGVQMNMPFSRLLSAAMSSRGEIALDDSHVAQALLSSGVHGNDPQGQHELRLARRKFVTAVNLWFSMQFCVASAAGLAGLSVARSHSIASLRASAAPAACFFGVSVPLLMLAVLYRAVSGINVVLLSLFVSRVMEMKQATPRFSRNRICNQIAY
uniref:Uncharacterized protein n=1 Tax=Erythrolobus madagascarensis TaxID=708628 RepID=A0A7S0T7C1_9RHOD|mmetsp:Transcript_3783/g.8340  ORF Transcript_3783/g.8340 Transcript_3783/m.8340 type:complete len:164 (+) Transcript_3783:1-492(+)